MSKLLADYTSEEKALNAVLHTLWTKAVGTPGYRKEEWKQLSSAIDRLITDGRLDRLP